MKACWGSGGIAPRIIDLGTRWGWVVSFAPQPLYPPGKEPLVPVGYEAGWVPESVWAGFHISEMNFMEYFNQLTN
jgi:hypothetical protein